jgi:hypothetical protein
VSNMSINHPEIRALAEGHWRSSMVIAHETGDAQVRAQMIARSARTIARFDERLKAMSALMPPEQAQRFLNTIEEQTEKIADELLAMAAAGGK